MKILYLALPAVLFFGSCISIQNEREFKQPSALTGSFMKILFSHEGDLLRDDAFKEEYFSTRLRNRIDQSMTQFATYSPPKNAPWEVHPAFPDKYNKAIFNAWDTPTRYTVGQQQLFDKVAVVDVIYLWGPEQQYPGDTRRVSVDFVYERGAWYIDDLETHKGKFTSGSSFFQTLIKG